MILLLLFSDDYTEIIDYHITIQIHRLHIYLKFAAVLRNISL